MSVASINELLEASAWVHKMLTTPAGEGTVEEMITGAYYGQIPDDAELPAIRFDSIFPQDVRGSANASQRIMVRIDWHVIAVTEGLPVAPLVPIANAIDERLHKVTGSTDTVEVLSCVRLYPFHLLERTDTGEHFRHAGGTYRTIVQAK